MKTLHNTHGWTFALLDGDNYVVYENPARMKYYHNPLAGIHYFSMAVAGKGSRNSIEGTERYHLASLGASEGLLKHLYGTLTDQED
jgi:hypothetical protein